MDVASHEYVRRYPLFASGLRNRAGHSDRRKLVPRPKVPPRLKREIKAVGRPRLKMIHGIWNDGWKKIIAISQ